MARLARLSIPGELHHVVQRGHNQQPVFRDDVDRQQFLQALREQSQEHQVAVHAYVLLEGEVHLLATPSAEGALGRLMQGLGRRYVAGHNRRHGRTGTLWEGRYRASILESERFFLSALVTFGWLPVRASLVDEPLAWPWSSARHHAGQLRDPVVVDHRLYWRLGNTPFDRELAYRRAVEEGVAARETEALLHAAAKSWALGSGPFLSRMQELTARPLGPRPRGRPRKVPGEPVPNKKRTDAVSDS